MKLSVETKVAAAVAAGFLAVSVGVVAQGTSNGESALPGDSSPAIQRDLHWHVDHHLYDTDGDKSGQ